MGHRLEPTLHGDTREPQAHVPTLRMLDGPRVGHVYVLIGGQVDIGEATDCTIAVPEAGLCPRQARVLVGGRGRPRLVDLAGDGTTVLNGRPVRAAELRDGDVLLLGKLVARFEYRGVVRWEPGHGPVAASVFRAQTVRERAVADLYARGLRLDLIARELDIAPGQVETIVAGLRERLQCSSRAALIAALCRE